MPWSCARLLGASLAVAAVVMPPAAVRHADQANGEPNAPRLDLEWTESVEGPPEHLLADGIGSIAIARDGRLVAFDRRGRRLWDTDVADGNAPLFKDLVGVGAGLVLLPVAEERLVCLDRKTGARRWEVSYPMVTGAAVGWAADGSALAAATNRAGKLQVMDALTGVPLWSVQLDEFDDGGRLDMWFGAGRLLLQRTPTSRGSMFEAFDAATGASVWSHRSRGATLASVVNDSVLFAENVGPIGDRTPVEALSLDLASGTRRWATRFETRGFYFSSLVSARHGAVFAVVDVEGQVRALNADTGEMLWQRATRRKQYEANLRIAGDVLALSTYDAGLLALSTRDGELVHAEGIGPTQLAVTIEAMNTAGKHLYLLISRNGESRDDGEVWSFRASG